MVNAALNVSREEIAEFCRRHHIRWLAVFGSAVRDDFRPESDVDVLVEFEPDRTPGLIRFARMERELTTLVDGRRVDLVHRPGLSRWIREPVLAEAEVLYDAA